MARSTRSTQLETRSARLKLPVAKKPVFVRVGSKIGLGYRRNQTAGTWVARIADGTGGNWTKAIGTADDHEDADGTHVLDFWQAQEKARALGRDDRGDTARPVTVAEALATYEADLRTRGGDRANVVRVRNHLTPAMLARPVALLTAVELRRWRDALAGSMAPSSVNRTCTAFKAALNLAAGQDERIANRRAWSNGLSLIPDAGQSRNVILDDATVRQLIAAAYESVHPEFGLLVEVAAGTGARISQIAGIEVQDLQADRPDPRVLMPTSRKGTVKKVARRPIPLPTGLSAKLQAVAQDRGPAERLLRKPSGERWKATDHRKLFRRTATAAGQEPDEVTMYALRHSNIVRQLHAGVPIRVVAVNHDTSVAMIERTYSRYIADHSDVLARGALLDTSAPPSGNVVPMRAWE